MAMDPLPGYYQEAAVDHPRPHLPSSLIPKHMPAYLIFDVTITDPATYAAYKELTPATLEPYGGRFLVRGGSTELLEGDRPPGRIVILEFPDLATAKRWWSSPEYGPAKAIRQSASKTWMVAVEGVQ